MAAVIYLRVSDPKQEVSGLGLEAQEAACQAWAAKEGVEIAGVYRDVLGGPIPPAERPGLTAALASMAPGDVLLVAKRDRLARDPYWMISIERVLAGMGARLVSAAGEASDDDSPTGILLRRVLDAFAEFERLMIRVRTKAAMAAKKRRGEWTGGKLPLWVQVVDQKLVDGRPVGGRLVYPAAVCRIIESTRDCTTRSVAIGLAGAGYTTTDGRPLHPSSVQALRRAIAGGGE